MSVSSFGDNHSSELCLAGAAAGFVATIFFTVKASFTAKDIIEDARYDIRKAANEEVKKRLKKDATKELVKLYAPAAGSALATLIFATAGSRISAHKNAALALSLGATKEFLSDYQKEVREEYGEAKERKIHDKVVERHKNDISHPAVVAVGEGDWKIRDSFTGQEFVTNGIHVQDAINRINNRLLQEHWISLEELYLEIDQTIIEKSISKVADRLGFNVDDGLIEIYWTFEGDSETGSPVAVMNYRIEPRERFDSWR